MLIFSFYFIFKLKFHQKKGHEIIQDARSNVAPTVCILSRIKGANYLSVGIRAMSKKSVIALDDYQTIDHR